MKLLYKNTQRVKNTEEGLERETYQEEKKRRKHIPRRRKKERKKEIGRDRKEDEARGF